MLVDYWNAGKNIKADYEQKKTHHRPNWLWHLGKEHSAGLASLGMRGISGLAVCNVPGVSPGLGR